MDPSGILPGPVPPGSATPPARTAVHRATVEDEILASWLELLIADGLIPPRATIGNPL